LIARRAKPLISYRVMVNLISATTTCTGLSVHCELDTNRYPKAIVVTDEEMDGINIKRADFHGEWNYTIPTTAQIELLIPDEPLAAARTRSFPAEGGRRAVPR
jgi:hypothetical protein